MLLVGGGGDGGGLSDSFLAVVASLRSLRLFSFFVTSSPMTKPLMRTEIFASKPSSMFWTSPTDSAMAAADE